MTKRFRLTILALAILCFLVVAPIALLYGWGYRYDLKNKTFIQTGAIYLKSLPRKAKIWLAGVEKKKTPLIIDGLLPKEYKVLVELEGFHPWQKTLEVKPILVTEAKNILLIPKNPKIVSLENKSEIEVKEFILSPDKEKLAFSFYGKEGSGIWILDLKQEEEVTLINNKILNLAQSYNDFVPLQWSADSNKLLLFACDKSKQDSLFIVDLENLSWFETLNTKSDKDEPPMTPPHLVDPTSSLGVSSLRNKKLIEHFKETGILNLTTIAACKPSKFLWHGKNPDKLLWLTPRELETLAGQAHTKKESALFQLDLSDSATVDEIPQILTEDIIDFTIDQANIYTIKPALSLSNGKAENIIKEEWIIYKNNFELAKFPEELRTPKELFILGEKVLAIKTDENKIYLLILEGHTPLLNDNPPLFLLAKTAKKVSLSPHKNKILYWQGKEIKIYFLQKNISYKKEKGDIETINLSLPVDEVLWYRDSEHLIYTQDSTIRITEIDPRGQRYDVEFVEGEEPIYDSTKDIIYFLNKGNLYKVNFPRNTIF